MSRLTRREQLVREQVRKVQRKQEEREALRQEACDEFQATWLEMNEKIGACWTAARRLIDEYGYDEAKLNAELRDFLGDGSVPKRMNTLITAPKNPAVRIDYMALIDADDEEDSSSTQSVAALERALPIPDVPTLEEEDDAAASV